jgi:hypothetical protein
MKLGIRDTSLLFQHGSYQSEQANTPNQAPCTAENLLREADDAYDVSSANAQHHADSRGTTWK